MFNMTTTLILLWTFQVSLWMRCLSVQFADKVNMLHQAAWTGNDTALRQLLNDVDPDARLLEGEVTALYRAASKHHRSTMNLLLVSGADINAEVRAKSMDLDGSPYDLLRYAVRLGDEAAVECLLKAGANVSSRSANSQYTPLHDAVAKRRRNVIELLVDNGANINADSAEGPPLSIAAREGSMDMVLLLHKHGADLNGTGTKKPPVAEAIAARHENVAMKLLELGADLYSTTGDTGLTPIHIAVNYGLNNLTKYLINKGLVNLKDKKCRTPLHLAENRDTADILLQGGAEVNAVTDKGETPLHRAAYFGMYDVTVLLVTNGARLDLLSNETYNIERSLNEQKISIGLNFEKTSKSGFTPLAMAIWAKNHQIASFLIQSNSPLNVANSEWPVFHIAAYLGEVATIQEMLEAGANVNISDNIGSTALHKVTLRGMTNVVRTLIRLGANVNASDFHGRTPLHVAVYHRRLEIAEPLIKSKSDVTAEDDTGFTVMTWAVVGRQPYLLKLMADNSIDLNSTNRYGYLEKMANEDIDAIVDLTLDHQPLLYPYHRDSLRQFLKRSAPYIGYDSNYISDNLQEYANFNGNTLNFDEFRKFFDSKTDNYKTEHVKMLKIILEKTADIDCQDSTMGWSVLHWAAATGDFDAVKLIIDKGARLSLKSNSKQTPMFLARYWGHRDIYQYFKKLGAVW